MEKVKNIVSLRECNDYKIENVDIAVDKMLADLGGIENFVKKGQTVVLKVNLLSKNVPNKAVTTHPSVVEAVAKKVVAAGAKCIIADSPATQYNKTHLSGIYEATGMNHAARQSGAIVNDNFNTFTIKNEDNKELRQLEICEVLQNCDVIINMSKMKTHSLTGYTGCVKNLFGVVPGLIKAQMHSLYPRLNEFCKLLINIEQTMKEKIVLHVCDAIVGMEGPGPASGTPRIIGRLIASTDPYAVDSTILKIMNIEPQTNPLMIEAAARGLVDTKHKYTIVGDSLEKSIITDYKIIHVTSDMETSVVPKLFRKTFRRYFQKKVIICPKDCKGCKKCQEHCPVGAIKMEYDKKGGQYAKIDYNKCINCFCCQELCPFHIVNIHTPVGYKMIQRKQLKKQRNEQKMLAKQKLKETKNQSK